MPVNFKLRAILTALLFCLFIQGSGLMPEIEDNDAEDALLSPTLFVDEIVVRAAIDRAEEIFDAYDAQTGDLNRMIFGDWERKLYLRPGLQLILSLNDPYNSLVDYSVEMLQRGDKPSKIAEQLVDRGEQTQGLVRFKGLMIAETAAALPGDLTLILEDDRGSTFSPLPGTHRVIPAGDDKYFFWTSFGHVHEVAPGVTELEPILKPDTKWLKLICITSHERKDLVWRFKVTVH